MVRRLARIVGVGVETADMLVHEVLSRPIRDRRAVARGACPRAGPTPDPGADLTGSPDESGARRREQGLARPAPGEKQGAGNVRVPHGSSPWAEGPRGMIQLA
jgi:transposase